MQDGGIGSMMRGFPPQAGLRVTPENWQASRAHIQWCFRNVRRMFPTAPIPRGEGPALAFERDPRDLDRLGFVNEGESRTIEAWLADSFTDGLLVLARGRIVYERYREGFLPETTHMCQSVTKSVVGDMIGCLAAEGRLDPEMPVAAYVPELARSGYGGATLRHLLDMQTGIRFSEDYYDPRSHSALLDIACGWAPRTRPEDPRSIYELLAGLERESAHGEAFTYRSADTDTLGWAAERATGRHLAELLGERIWSKLGTEHEAYICLDGVGTALADGGLCVSLRDLGRFAEMHRNLGYFNGRQIVPAEWVRQSRAGEAEKFRQEPFRSQMPKGAYRNQWWVADGTRGIHLGRGIYGQMIYIDPEAEMTAVKFSSWPKPTMPEQIGPALRAFEAIAAAVRRS